MSESELRAWLETHGLEGVADSLAAEDITLDLLPELSEDDLRELGLSMGMRRRLRRALDGDGNGARTPERAPAESQQAERRRITVVFVDLVGSTSLSAHMDPEELREHINAFQACTSEVVTRFGGFVARFMGDGLLAYFGYPTAHEDDAERALRAGLEAVSRAATLSTPLGPAAVRVGIASGLVVVGDVLSAGETRERSVVGETPNLAARLQAIAAPGEVVVAARTRRLAGEAFTFRALGGQTLKGFDEPVEAFVVGAARTERTRFDARAGIAGIPLLGRDMELSLLRERWQLARGGEGQAVVLAGEAGIGKSRITHSLIEEVRSAGQRCMVHQCSPLRLDTPLWPVLEQIRGALALDALPDASSRRERLQHAFGRAGVLAPQDVALIGDALGLPAGPDEAPPDLTSQQRRQRVLQALLTHILALARERPLLILMEDIHWLDPSTSELLEASLQAMDDAPVMLLMTSRAEGAPEWSEYSHVTRLTLNRLSRQATEEIVRAVAREHALPAELVGRIVSRTDGVPLFVEELTRAVLESGPSSPGGARDVAEIPDTLHDSLMARLDRVPALKGVAQTAACIGRVFDFRLLVEVCELPAGELEEALDGLVEAGLVFRQGTPPAARYTFKHALVRDAAYESTLNAQRRATHSCIADALAASQDAAPELVGMHSAHAGETERAIAAYLVAGERAAQAFANAEAVSHYHQVLELLATLPGDARRDAREFEVLQALGVPLIGVRGYASPEVETLFERAVSLCDALGVDDQRRFMVLRGLWNCVYDRSELGRSRALAEELVALGARHADPAEAALAHRALGSTLYVQGELAPSLEQFRRVLEAPSGWSTAESRAVHGEAPEIIALQYMGWVDAVQGRMDTALERVREALARSRETGMPITVAFALAITEIVHWMRGEAQDCSRVALETRKVTEEHGFPFWRAHSEVFAGWAQAESTGDLESVARVRAGLDAWTRTGAQLHVPTWSCVLAQAALAAGADAEARAAVHHARECAERTGERFMLPELLRLAAELGRRDGSVREARALLEQALALSREHGSHWLGLAAAADLARLEQAAGEPAAALPLLEEAVSRVEEGHDCPAFVHAAALARELRAAS